MRRALEITAAMVVTLIGLGCSRRALVPEAGRAETVAEVSEAGLEAMTFVSGVDEGALARVLGPGAEGPLPVASGVAELWGAHGFRIVAVRSEAVEGLVGALRSSGGAQKQWLGQAYAWTEVARGVETQGRVVALDAERIRLPAGTLRMLARSWLEPAPPGAGVGGESGAPAARLHVELVPQNLETRRAEEIVDPLALGSPRIEAEAQGMLFSRLYASMSLAPGQSLLVVPERPDADWKLLSAEKPANTAGQAADGDGAGSAGGAASGGTARIGQVVRGGRNGAGRGVRNETPGVSLPEGPSGPRVLTLGEALLLVDAGATGRGARNPQRTILVLTARVPKEFRLLPSAPVPVSPAGATRSGESGRRG